MIYLTALREGGRHWCSFLCRSWRENSEKADEGVQGLAPGPGGVTTPSLSMAGKLTYKDAGVDTVKAAALVGEIKTHVNRTQKQRQLMGAFGLFAAARFFATGLRAFLEAGADLVDLLVPVFRAIEEGTGSKECASGE